MTAIGNKAIYLTILLYIFKVNSKSIGTESDDWDTIASKALENDILYPNNMNDVEYYNANIEKPRWLNGIVYYAFDSNFPNRTLVNGILSKMSTDIGLNSKGTNCIKFIPRTTQTNYVNYWTGNSGCSSYVGMIGGRQNISLGKGCIYTGTIMHETMHALGFWHEHSREDRDSYVTVHFENILPANQNNFHKLSSSQERLFASFDLTSIMIYGNYAFSKNNQKTIVANNGQTLYSAYRKYALTFLNIKAIRAFYNCN